MVDKTIPGNDKIRAEKLEEWGKAIINELKKRGYYINKVKGDPSGRW